MAKAKGRSKKELLIEQIADAVGAGREVAVEIVDFSDPNRPKTCLEVDFPIIPINQIAALEASSGALKKPIYGMSKWWARRQPSVFRAMLLAASMKAPDDESKAAKAVWQVYYANHQKRGSLKALRVADPFMGGGTTIVEGSRLGMQMFGSDLNPVAWFIVHNEFAKVDVNEVNRLLSDIEAEVKPLIMPYYACDGPDGEKGKWFRLKGTKKKEQIPLQLNLTQVPQPSVPESENDWEEVPAAFDIFSVPWEERNCYRYEGPEILYTFWSKHISCQRQGCGHRTPIVSTPVVASRILSVDTWKDYQCPGCGNTFDVERQSVRMAPDAPLFVAPDEGPFASMDAECSFKCPHCGLIRRDERAFVSGKLFDLGDAVSKKIEVALLIHPSWLEGCNKLDDDGNEYGGSATDSVEATSRWNDVRAANLRLLEVRGALPETVICPETRRSFRTDTGGGTLAKKSTVACAADGTPNSILESTEFSGKTGPIATYAVQGYSQKRRDAGLGYGGRFFFAPTDTHRQNHALMEWELRKTGDLAKFWPKDEVTEGLETTVRTPLHKYHYHRWADFFTAQQLLVHAQLLKSITNNEAASQSAKMFVLGAFQQYLRCNNLMSIWHTKNNQISAFLSNPNFHPKPNSVEPSVFAPVGDGSWRSASSSLLESLQWRHQPWELVVLDALVAAHPEYRGLSGNTIKAQCNDPVLNTATLAVSSATDLKDGESGSYDLVITDPPFGDILQYAELSTFFYVWIRLALAEDYPEYFRSPSPPLLIEAVENSQRHGSNSEEFYKKTLTESWKESYRILKPGGILAFTFHHDKDGPWVSVLESLFNAGFYLEAAYPIRSDETKGEGGTPGTYGAQKVEYDIIHVCRKRMTEPQPISWARLRRLIMDDVRNIRILLTQHQSAGLPAADLQVIKRGKALEYFSRHYGKVYIEQGREFTIREALAGINQLLDDDSGTSGGSEAPPSNAEPYTCQFFRIFYETTQVPRDQMQKFLRGTGIAPSDFVERGWCSEKSKVFTLTPPTELARAWKGASRRGMARDFDQTMFLIGGCFEGSNIRVTDTLDSPNFAPHPATAELVDWLISHGGSPQIKIAAQRAQTIYRDWLGRNKAKAQEQLSLFDLEA
jgi:predicted RNA-binding Zn-ribbon protein involved in translation (DUF1610 family)